MATEVLADTAGSVWKVLVENGDVVEEGQTLIILESMKMEIPAVAPTSGTLDEVRVKEGEAVDEDHVLAVLS